MPIKIDFLANVRDFLRGTDDAEDALDDVADSLDDMGDAAKKGGREAERSIEKLEDNFRDAARRAKDLGDAGKDAGRDVKRGMDDADDAVGEFKDEAASTARESAASFDGSAESIVDSFQEIAANAFAGFGPAGAAAGLVAAAGIGLAVKAFTDADEAAKESEARAAKWADAYVEAGSRILSAAQVVEGARAIVTDPEQYKTAKQNAEDWGVSESTALLAMAGDTNALIEAKEALAKKAGKVDDAVSKLGNAGLRGLSYEMRTARGEVSRGTESLNQITGEMDRGSEQADVYSTSLRLLAEHTEGATTKVDEFGDSIVSLPDGKQIYIDAETGRATENVDAIENKIYGIRDKRVDVNVRANLGSATTAYDNWIKRHNGKSIKIYGRYVSPPGSENWG